jgi:hypothetical protein
VVVIPDQYSNLISGLQRFCCGWLVTVGLDTNVLLLLLKRWTQLLTANVCGILTIHASKVSVDPYQHGNFSSKKFSYHTLPYMYIHHFALLLC